MSTFLLATVCFFNWKCYWISWQRGEFSFLWIVLNIKWHFNWYEVFFALLLWFPSLVWRLKIQLSNVRRIYFRVHCCLIQYCSTSIKTHIIQSDVHLSWLVKNNFRSLLIGLIIIAKSNSEATLMFHMISLTYDWFQSQWS